MCGSFSDGPEKNAPVFMFSEKLELSLIFVIYGYECGDLTVVKRE